MHNLIRFYNRNRKAIFRIILIIVLLVLGIQILNGLTKQKYNIDNTKNIIQNTTKNDVTKNNTKINNTNKEIKSDKSAVTGEKVSTEKIKKESDTIKEFIDACNNADIEKAYSYLSDDCKDREFSDINIFKEVYYTKVFNGEKKIFTMQNWASNIYKVEISNDIMSTGKTEKKGTIQDYITISNDKININGYVGKEILNKESEKEKLNIKVIEKNEYMDYVVFKFEITNRSSKTAALDLLDDINSMYVLDGSNVKHSAYTHELSKTQLIIDANTKKQLEIKYYSKYTSTRKIEEIAFTKVVLNYLGEGYLINNYSNIFIDL